MSASNILNTVATVAPAFGPIGAIAGAGISILGEFVSAAERRKEADRQRMLANRAEAERVSQLYYQGLAKGGVVKGPGTENSDSVKTQLEEGDVVIPAKNAILAQQIAQEFLGWKPGKTVDFGGESNVALSNKEFVFKKKEAEKLLELGIDINDLI